MCYNITMLSCTWNAVEISDVFIYTVLHFKNFYDGQNTDKEQYKCNKHSKIVPILWKIFKKTL